MTVLHIFRKKWRFLYDEIKRLAEIEDEDDFVDAIRELIQGFLALGTVKSFQVKDPTGKLLCEYDDGFYD